jgi:large conductance mechanosensitive channel
MPQGFKTFIMRGNVVDLAVGVVIGAAFMNVVNSFVVDIITPFIAALFKQPDFSGFSVVINGSTIMIGRFLDSMVSFAIMAAVIYYFVIIPLNRLFAHAGVSTRVGDNIEKK